VWITSPLGRFSILLSGGEEETLQQFRARRTSSTHCSGHAQSLYLFGFSSFRLFGFRHISAIPWWSIPCLTIPSDSFLLQNHTFCAPLQAAHRLHGASLDTQPYKEQQTIKHHALHHALHHQTSSNIGYHG